MKGHKDEGTGGLLRGSCNVLESVIIHQRLPKCPVIHSTTSSSPKLPTLGQVPGHSHWATEGMIPHRRGVVSHGLPHSSWIRTATITSTNRQWHCNSQVSSWDPQVVMVYLTTLILSFFFFLCPYTFSQELFCMLLYCCVSNQNRYILKFANVLKFASKSLSLSLLRILLFLLHSTQHKSNHLPLNPPSRPDRTPDNFNCSVFLWIHDVCNGVCHQKTWK